MRRRPDRRTAVVVLVSVGAHLAVLWLLGRAVPRAYALRTGSDERAVTISLLPGLPPPPARLSPVRSAPVRRHLTPLEPTAPKPLPMPAPPVPTSTAVGSAPAGATASPVSGVTISPPPPDAAALRLGEALRRHTGCADPDGLGLTGEERAACAERLAQTGARVLGLGIAADKQAAYDRVERCRHYDQAHMANGLEPSNVAGGMAGLGQVPRGRDCPPGH